MSEWVDPVGEGSGGKRARRESHGDSYLGVPCVRGMRAWDGGGMCGSGGGKGPPVSVDGAVGAAPHVGFERS